MTDTREWSGFEIAIIGMAGRFPGAPDVASLWRNLEDGVGSIRRLDPEELIRLGRDPEEVRAPNFVPAHGVLDGFDQFDAEFFGYRSREAEAMDPQQRLFLETVWAALENAGCDPSRYTGQIGLFAGSSMDHYLHEQVRANPAALARIGDFQAAYSNQMDHLVTRVSYKLNLTGPSFAVQSACSTSLVAVHIACQQLLTAACDVAIAGGVSLTLPRHWGYRFEEGMILAPDGQCRAFDVDAQGCLKGDGVGAVVLKRLADALADGDRIEAVILGSAANNDGADKVGYTAPGLDGQVRLIETAQAVAGVSPDEIGYVEAHGTGTPLGDPIEIAALTQVFRQGTERRGYCGIGSIKTNIGHLDAAAGVAGLIKAALAVKHGVLPPSLNFRAPNPRLALDTSPFFVVDRRMPWPAGDGPRRAAVSSFGIGGTNAHVILEAPPAALARPAEDGARLLLLSARSPAALDAQAARLADHLEVNPGLDLGEVAFTLQEGRQALPLRRALVATDVAAAVAALRDPRAGSTGRARDPQPQLVFMFPGQGAQYVGMGRQLYADEPLFRAHLDECVALLRPLLGFDLTEVLYPPAGADGDALEARLRQTAVAQPALFAIEYALARYLMDIGLEPAAMVGHSLGEWVAACLAGVLSLAEALALVVERGRLMQAQPAGVMLAVALPRSEVEPLLGPALSLAAENAPGMCVVSGPEDATSDFAARLLHSHGIEASRLHTSHAFHSAMMEPAVAPFLDALARVPRQAPQRPYVSTVSGGWAGEAEVAGTALWAGNIRGTVQFARATETLLALENPVFIEVGPGTTLSGLVRKHPARPASLLAVATLRHPNDASADKAFLLASLGRLWSEGVPLGRALLGDGPFQPLALPAYPFDGPRLWIDAVATAPAEPAAAGRRPAGEWLHVPSWLRTARPATPASLEGLWLVLGDGPRAAALSARIAALGGHAQVLPADAGGSAVEAGQVIFLVPDSAPDGGFGALLAYCRQRLEKDAAATWSLTVVAENAWSVLGNEVVRAERVLPHGLVSVLPAEAPGVQARFVDIAADDPAWVERVLAEAASGRREPLAAWRHGQRWRYTVEPLPAPPVGDGLPARLRQGGCYLITGGLGGMGLALAELLARRAAARLVLVGRSPLPARDGWMAWLQTHAADDATSQRIRRLLAIEEAGGQVLAVSADVADAAAMAALRQRVEAEFGPVNGIVHCAGVAGGGAIALLSPEQVAAVLAPKVAGVRVLHDCYADQALDFMVLCSSLTSIVGRAGRAEYTAANLFLDAFANSIGAPRLLAINWDNWTEAGMAREARAAPLEGLSNADGGEAFLRALGQDAPQVLVSTRDPALLLRVGERALAESAAASREAAPAPALADAAEQPDGAAAVDGPRTPAEATLVSLWKDLLGVSRVGIHDDFFELGGDSVVSIQLVARAKRAGLSLGVKQIFELRTVERLAAAVGTPAAVPAPAPSAPPEVASEVPLTPIQRWFFEQPVRHRGHWNLSLWADTPADLDTTALAQAWTAVVHSHDVFSLRYEEGADGPVQRVGAAADSPLECVRLDGDVATQGAALQAHEQALQAALDLQAGPLLRARHVALGGEGGRLLVVAHHLASDVIALKVLLEDLNEAYAQCRGGQPVKLSAPSASFIEWARAQDRYARSDALLADLAYWAGRGQRAAVPLPRDNPDADNRAGDSASQRIRLDAATTRALAARGGQAALSALLAGLSRAIGRWAGSAEVWFDIEGHGRESFADGPEVSRTVGWFTSLYPLAVACGGDVRQAAGSALAALAEVPAGGSSYGLLRYANPSEAVRRQLAALPRPQVVVLYQGVQRDAGATPAALRLAQIGSPLCRAADEARSHVFELNAWIADDSLHLEWHYSTALHRPETIAALAEDFRRELVELASEGRTPAAPRKAPLSFAQERIWFLEQLDAGAAIYNKQAVLDIRGPLRENLLGAALDALAERHEALRTRFGTDDGVPFQEILPAAPVELLRLTVASQAEADARCREWARQAFELSAAAPWRAGLLAFGDGHHRLVLTLHHIITDAWSMRVLINELAALYGGLAGGGGAALAPVPMTLADFALWQRNWLPGANQEHLLDFWLPRLQGLRPLDLPTDRPRPAIQRFDGARQPFTWSAELTAGLRARGREQGASLFMVLLALLKVLLYRYSGQTDVVVGVPAADRSHVETEGLVGPLVNNLVMRTDLSGDPDFAALLARVRETALSAHEHRELPFEKLVEALRPERDRSRSPLFQVMFAFMNVPENPPDWGDLTVQAEEVDAGNAEFDLGFYCYDPGNGPAARLSGWIEYSTALFDASTVARLAGQFERLAEAVLETPAQPVGALEILPAAERTRLVTEWNETFVARRPGVTLHRLFEEQAAAQPAAPAAVADEGSLSYAELELRANRLAAYLVAQGVQPDDRVALFVDRGLDMMVGLLGILKAGAGYVPVDPLYPEHRVEHMLLDSGARIVVTQRGMGERLQGLDTLAGLRQVALDSDWAAIAALPAIAPAVAVGADNLAYVIYTSGSTGKPKGVQIEHGAVVNFIEAMRSRPGLTSADALLAVTTISFDIHVLELFLPLAVGARVVVASRDTAADPARLARALEEGVTVMQATPSTWRMLLDADWRGRPGLKALCGGERLPADLAARLLGRIGELWNMYGPTEATVWACVERIVDAETGITVGKPFDNMRTYVLDGARQLLPTGARGELWIGGSGVARGYLNRPELNAERFVADPYAAGGRIYATGDLARFLADGRIEILGRLDNQVKLRGHRIELGEVENALAQHPAVNECAAVVREEASGDQRLVAYATPAGSERPDLATLRGFAGAFLPGYMLPSALVWLERFPQTPNGKVDRKALPAPADEPKAVSRPAVDEGMSEAERELATIFAEVLGLERVGRYDNFFDLGGHSLLAVKVVDRLEKRSGVRIPPGELFQQTVGQIAAQYADQIKPTAAAGEEAQAGRSLLGSVKSLFRRKSAT
ncbi:MAG: amino acid adenylation domain-containing protein [Proteobacteria bacterium]|nr:amino acid adenylation domain-containing protein [Pseudomonadota bacterium]